MNETTISQLANTEAATARSSRIPQGITRFGGAVAAGVVAVLVTEAVHKGISKLTGADKKAAEEREKATKAADERLRKIMNESAERTARALSEILNAPAPQAPATQPKTS